MLYCYSGLTFFMMMTAGGREKKSNDGNMEAKDAEMAPSPWHLRTNKTRDTTNKQTNEQNSQLGVKTSIMLPHGVLFRHYIP